MRLSWRNFSNIFFLSFLIATLFVATRETRAAKDFVPTLVEVKMACGDGFRDPLGEFCDPGNPLLGIPPSVGTSTCQMFPDIFGSFFTSGNLTCNNTCTAYDTDPCFTCGNSHRETMEQCDGSSFGVDTCLTYGFDSGSLVCTNQCQVSTMNCEARADEGGLPGGGGGGLGGGGSAGAPVGFIPGANQPYSTNVIIRGKSYPSTDVHILLDGKVLGIVKSDNKADFYFETKEVTPGVTNFGFWSEDVFGLKSTLLNLTFRVVSGAATTISGVYISPSIDVDKKSLQKGENIKIFGQSVPSTQIKVHVNSAVEHIIQTNAAETGKWELTFNTEPLEDDFHTAKSMFEVKTDEGQIVKSGFSKSVSFYINKTPGKSACPNADLNKDKRVNLVDFSILLYYWNTNNNCADQNTNGKVDLVDFSIMMYYWTG